MQGLSPLACVDCAEFKLSAFGTVDSALCAAEQHRFSSVHSYANVWSVGTDPWKQLVDFHIVNGFAKCAGAG